VTQITERFPDPLGPYYVRFGPHPFRPAWRRALHALRQAALGAGIGWLGAQALAGNVHPVFAVIWPIFLVAIFYPGLAMKMSHDIARTRMYHSVALSSLEMAKLEDVLRPREELGAQSL